MNSMLLPPLDPRGTVPRVASVLLGALIVCAPARPARAEGAMPPSKQVDSWQNAERMTPEELAQLLRSPGADKPAIFNVGFRVLYAQAHIPGAEFAGPGKDQVGLDALRKAVSSLPRAKPIVLYCGCCPWERCPNLEKPWKQLVAAGFTHVKVLYIPKNFGQDWVQKGYPVEASDPGRG